MQMLNALGWWSKLFVGFHEPLNRTYGKHENNYFNRIVLFTHTFKQIIHNYHIHSTNFWYKIIFGFSFYVIDQAFCVPIKQQRKKENELQWDKKKSSIT